MKYIFKQIDDISKHNAEITVEFSAYTLPDILEQFEMFLRGSGFNPLGTLDFVEDELPERSTPECDTTPELKEEQRIELQKQLRNDSGWPFPKTSGYQSLVSSPALSQLFWPKQKQESIPDRLFNSSKDIYGGDLNSPSAGASDKLTSPEQGVTPSVAMQWTVDQLINPPQIKDFWPFCPICKIDKETMLHHECWDKNCPKGQDGNQG